MYMVVKGWTAPNMGYHAPRSSITCTQTVQQLLNAISEEKIAMAFGDNEILTTWSVYHAPVHHRSAAALVSELTNNTIAPTPQQIVDFRRVVRRHIMLDDRRIRRSNIRRSVRENESDDYYTGEDG